MCLGASDLQQQDGAPLRCLRLGARSHLRLSAYAHTRGLTRYCTRLDEQGREDHFCRGPSLFNGTAGGPSAAAHSCARATAQPRTCASTFSHAHTYARSTGERDSLNAVTHNNQTHARSHVHAGSRQAHTHTHTHTHTHRWLVSLPLSFWA